MAKCILFFYIIIGKVEHTDNLYTVHAESDTYEFACEGEVLKWVETGTFVYDDSLCACGELQ
jgi:hypothetical protein